MRRIWRSDASIDGVDDSAAAAGAHCRGQGEGTCSAEKADSGPAGCADNKEEDGSVEDAYGALARGLSQKRMKYVN